MKKFSKLLSAILVLVMVFSLCGCGDSKKALYGTWNLDCDFSELLAEQMGEDFSDFNCAFPMTLTFEFKEDGGFVMAIDKDSFTASLSTWTDAFIQYSMDVTYKQFEDQGIDKAAADEQIESQLGCSMEEYFRTTFEESLNADTLTADMRKEGTFEVKNNQIFMYEAGQDKSTVGGNPYSVTADTLTIKQSVLEDDEEIFTGLSYPLVLKKAN